ncbi:putative F-box protein At1g47790 [Silene latifolia]|uniref:putative F-box protein At1g47790 n=1 Tax=Silene latifolia TaxID=37657 RepID=UPI003D777037
MEVRKRLTVTAEVDPPCHHHRYPTRWKLRRHASHSSLSSHPQANVTVHVPCKRKKVVKCILYLPRDIMFDILLLVPVIVLHQVVRYVCKPWNDIVNDPRFIKAHYQLSSAGLLVQNPLTSLPIYNIEGDNSTEFEFPSNARIFGSFNGLVLFHDLNNLQILSVINPVTKVKISLPPVHGLNNLWLNIGFAISSCGHYNVVVTPPNKVRVMVFTIGIDKAWRFIDLQGKSEMKSITRTAPRFIAGMLYFCNSSNFPCFAMDVDTETIYVIDKPNEFADMRGSGRILRLGACLGLAQQERGNWNLWKLTDVKSGKWTKLDGIIIGVALSTVMKELHFECSDTCLPVILMDDIFWFYYVVERQFVVVRFNLANQSFVFLPIKYASFFTQLFHHVHTLLSPNKCYL